jgi:hypothetical protein
VALDHPADCVCHGDPIIYNLSARMTSRLLLSLATSWLVGCSGGSGPGGDAGTDVLHGTSFEQPIGATCNATESLLCANGVGACHARVCCAFCSAVSLPRCAAGTTEVHDTVGDREICLCAPS